MERVSVATLKNNLSGYLAAVKEGREIVVTSHRHPIARIVPMENAASDLKIIPAKRELTQSILNRASQSFLTPLGTLDAVHLATALRLVEASGIELTFLTHDTELATAARSMSFSVKGV